MDDSPRIPSANEFAPGQIGELPPLLKMLKDVGGDKEALQKKISQEVGWDKPKRVNNVLIGLRSYGILDDDNRLTEIGEELVGISDDAECYQRFSEYILVNKSGLKVLEAIDACKALGQKATKANLAVQLNLIGCKSAQGKDITTNSTDHTQLLAWLGKSGLASSTPQGYDYDDQAVNALLGYTVQSVEEFQNLTPQQRVFLEILKFRSQATDEFILGTNLISDCKDKYPSLFVKTDQLAKVLFNPLEVKGWIEIKDAEKKGRGGKAPWMKSSEKLDKLDLSVVQNSISNMPNELVELIKTPLNKVALQLESNDSFTKGLALEILALRLSYDLGLIPISLRERSSATGGAEVDLVAEGIHLHYYRWLIQCKNTPSSSVPLSALAKEIGMATILKAHVVVLVTTSTFASTVVTQARKLSEETPLQAILVDGNVVNAYLAEGPEVVIAHFKNSAKSILEQKRIQLEEAQGL